LIKDAIRDITGSTEKIEKYNIKTNGKIPVITQEKEKFISGYSDNDNPITDVPVILFGDHSCTFKYIDFKFFRGADGTVLLKPKDNFEPKYFYHVLRYLSLDSTENTDKYERHYKYIRNMKIPCPPLDIQQYVVAEIEALENNEAEAKGEIAKELEDITNILRNIEYKGKKLRNICRYSGERVPCRLLTSENYIGVDNLLQNAAGKINSSFVPDTGTVTKYGAGDILLSNIRPYLKKIWYAENDGGCSNDILVLQKTAEGISMKYVFYNMRQDSFFDYEMLAAKGVKMPRGDKQHILEFEIPVPPLSEQQRIVSEIEKAEARIAEAQKIMNESVVLKNEVLRKHIGVHKKS
jgi:type I restriction enzyme M protein